LCIPRRFIKKAEGIDIAPLSISDNGVPYRLFIDSCKEKKKIKLIKINKRSPEFNFLLFFTILSEAT
jgi:hypothetical protein